MTRLGSKPLVVVLLALTLAACGGGKSAEEKLAQIAVWDDQGSTADGQLTKLLFDSDAEVRRRAALALGRINDTLAMDSLALALKNDRDPSVRAMAAFAFGPGRWRTGARYLLEALDQEDDPRVITEILQACGSVYARDGAEKIVPFLRHDDPKVRAQALLTLDIVNRHDLAADAMVDLLEDENREVQWAALFALVRAKSRGAGERALLLCRDTSVSMRRLAYRVAGAISTPATEDILFQGLEDPDPIVRSTAAETFAVRLDTNLILKVFPYLESEEDPRVLISLIRAIGEHWRTAARPHLEKMLDHPDPGVRAATVEALGHRLDFNFAHIIAQAARDPEPRVRRAYIEILDDMRMYAQQLDTTGFISQLRTLTSDSIPLVRARAVQSYLTHGGAESDRYLNQLYNDPDPYCVQTAVSLIGTFRVGHYQDSLHALYQEYRNQWRPEIKWAILAATANLSPSVHADSVRRDIFDWGMADPNRLVRWYTIAVWEKFREDRRAELGTYYTDLTVENVTELLNPYPANPQARLETTKGPVTIELRTDLAPRTVRRFIEIAREGGYDNCPMNDIQTGNIVQTGDRRGDGWGLPGVSVRDEMTPEPIQAGSVIWLINTRDSGHGAFGIALDRLPYLDWRYGIFGTVVDGLERVAALTFTDTLRTVEVLTPGA